MKKHSIGILSIILGVLFLSLEIFCLPLIKAANAFTQNGFYESALHYLFEMPGIIALLVTLSVIVYGVYIVVENKEKQDNG